MLSKLFKRKDPVCGMREEKGKGIEKDGNWFCSEVCAKRYRDAVETSKNKKIGGCCHS